ncbi:MAG: 2TM domain-containing protein [Leptolyngbya sp. IPPAS B-1204]|nr:2TM domain-containing protein [Elainella sp. C42_A2020_010]RNJ68175.1 MAG: hypothetical protein EDM05_17195 [Leptolyngbya sp. IPPAS B-1204]
MTTTPHETYYRSEDAQQILNLAIARQAEAGELTRTQLFEIAAELNIAPADILAAEQEWLAHQGEQAERQAFDRVRQGRFRSQAVKHLIFAGFFLALYLLFGGQFWLFPVFVGGVSLALSAWKTYFLSEDDYNQAFQQWRQRQRLKQTVTSFVNRCLGV